MAGRPTDHRRLGRQMAPSRLLKTFIPSAGNGEVRPKADHALDFLRAQASQVHSLTEAAANFGASVIGTAVQLVVLATLFHGLNRWAS